MQPVPVRHGRGRGDAPVCAGGGPRGRGAVLLPAQPSAASAVGFLAGGFSLPGPGGGGCGKKRGAAGKKTLFFFPQMGYNKCIIPIEEKAAPGTEGGGADGKPLGEAGREAAARPEKTAQQPVDAVAAGAAAGGIRHPALQPVQPASDRPAGGGCLCPAAGGAAGGEPAPAQ